MNPKISTDHLKRRAIVYIRQSSPGQVIHNQESQRRQYGLADHARHLGFQKVEIIDEDLGRSGSGQVERPGFQHLVAEVCTGEVGAVLCIEASRLARNGRDWHHLIELCGLVRAIVIDPDGVYDPGVLNDRLLLGLKGTMSEFELNLLRQRSLEAIRQKARRGELQFRLPVGFRWASNGKVEIDPDRRVQEAVHLVFTKMVELGSARQVLLWFRGENTNLPALVLDAPGHDVVWKLPVYNTIWHLLRNPMYAGAYAFGKTESRTKVINGRARKSEGHFKSRDTWMVLIHNHHPGYISWEQFERNQAMLSDNAHMKSRMEPKAGRGGRSLLAGVVALPALRENAPCSLQRHARRRAPISLPRCADQSRNRLVHLVRRIETGSRRCGRDPQGGGRQRHRGSIGSRGTCCRTTKPTASRAVIGT